MRREMPHKKLHATLDRGGRGDFVLAKFFKRFQIDLN
jgi:hypothetical protein